MTDKHLFVDNGCHHGTVLLNRSGIPEEEFGYFAEAFHLAAREVVASLKKDADFGFRHMMDDFKAYPVAFLYRHALELHMKDFLFVGSPMLSAKNMAPLDWEALLKTHSLDKLRQHVERVFEAYGWEWNLGTPHFRSLQDFRKVISELHEVDARSDAFRYPLDTKGDASLSSHFSFNLFHFSEVLDGLLSAFEGAVIGAREELRMTLEGVAEAQREQDYRCQD